MRAYELFATLYKKNLIDIQTNPLWWEHCGTFQTLIEVFLTQQTKWACRKSMAKLPLWTIIRTLSVILSHMNSQ
jgi:endonuclease III-like uncharacterized protein